MASSMEEQSLDLTTCCICLESYDLNEHKPKHIPCTHTFCQGCLKGINRDIEDCVTCPVCKNKYKLPVATVEGLPNNLGLIHIIKLENEKKAGQSWCLTCDTLVKPTCLEARHKTHSLLEEAEECQAELDDMLKGFKAGDAMRERVDGVLQAKLRALQAQIAENNNGRRKILAAIVCCQEMAKLSPGMKTSAVMRKKLEQMKKQMKGEVEQAKNLLERHAQAQAKRSTEQPIAEVSVARKSVKRTAEATEAAGDQQNRRHNSHGDFAAKCFSLHRKESDFTSSFHCKEFLGNSIAINTIEFSDDGKLLASGGSDKIVRLWLVFNEASVANVAIVPLEMKTRHDCGVESLALAPDSSRLYSGGSNGKIFIHDVHTEKLLNSVENDTMKNAISISLKPGSNGNVFATADFSSGDLRIFDIRQSTSIPVFEEKHLNLRSVMYSPVDSSLIAVAGYNGTQILDIRNINGNSRYAYSLGNWPGVSARFNGLGNRLLCKQFSIAPIIYNVSSEQRHQRLAATRVPTDKVQLAAEGYSFANPDWFANCCFAGDDDELVVAAPSNKNVFIWSVPDGQGYRTIDQSLLSLTGQYQCKISSVRFNKATSTLAFGDQLGLIKLWTPTSTSR